MSINFNNRVAILEEISKGDYTSDTHINLISPITQKSRDYIVEDVTKSIVTTEGKLAMNCGTDLYVIDSYGILLKKYPERLRTVNIRDGYELQAVDRPEDLVELLEQR